MNKRVCVVGLGYIGLPTAALISKAGYSVIGYDINEEFISNLRQGIINTKEPLLENYIREAILKGSLVPETNPMDADVFIVCVPTPLNTSKKCDLTYLIDSISKILPLLRKGNLVIIESTVPPGTLEDIVKPLVETTGLVVGDDINLCHCPERVLPGNIIYELVNNNRVIGGVTDICTYAASNFYKSFVKGEIVETDSKTAEMAKLVENTFRDLNIALANELICICDSLNIDGLKVIDCANMHPRVNILNPGPGVGGHCLAIDPYFIVEKSIGLSSLISKGREVNLSMPLYVVEKIKSIVRNINNPKITILGLSYKGNVDDIRESPSIQLLEFLKKDGFIVSAYDPYVTTVSFNSSSISDALRDSDLLVIATDHDFFRYMDYVNLSKYMRSKIIFDTRNILRGKDLDPQEVKIFNMGNTFSI